MGADQSTPAAAEDAQAAATTTSATKPAPRRASFRENVSLDTLLAPSPTPSDENDMISSQHHHHQRHAHAPSAAATPPTAAPPAALTPHQARVQKIMGDKYPNTPTAYAPSAAAAAAPSHNLPSSSSCNLYHQHQKMLNAVGGAPATASGAPSAGSALSGGAGGGTGGKRASGNLASWVATVSAPTDAPPDELPVPVSRPTLVSPGSGKSPGSSGGGRRSSYGGGGMPVPGLSDAPPPPTLSGTRSPQYCSGFSAWDTGGSGSRKPRRPSGSASPAANAAAAASAEYAASWAATACSSPYKVSATGPLPHQISKHPSPFHRTASKELSRLYSLPSLDALPSGPPRASTLSSSAVQRAAAAPTSSSSSCYHHHPPHHQGGDDDEGRVALPSRSASYYGDLRFSGGSANDPLSLGFLSEAGNEARVAQHKELQRESSERRLRLAARHAEMLEVEEEEKRTQMQAKAEAEAQRKAKLIEHREHERARMRQKLQDRDRAKAKALVAALERAVRLEHRQRKATLLMQAGARRMLARAEARRRRGDLIQKQLNAFQAAWAAKARSSADGTAATGMGSP